MMKPTHPTPSSSATVASSSHAQCYDPLDLFTNVEDLYPSPSVSPPSSSRSSASSFQAPATANPNNTLLPPDQSFGSSFSGPSHQYDRYKQQTGIPADVFAQTLAVNPASKMYNQIQYGFSDVFDSTNVKGEDDPFDFNTTSAQFSSASDMDMEYDTPSADGVQPTFFFPEQSSSASSEYINPSTIEEESDSLSTSKIGQLYPGMHQQMHQQQAALAKAQAEQQKQQTLQPQKQRQRAAVAPPSKKPNRSHRAGAQQPTDPMVEDRISRLLSSMRQSSIAASDEDASGRDGLLPHISRMKKEEEDMDEDERLLASEEGKKLSSKERRQLRNKVSARAFRSRRKEYIGQLEAEVATKINEANDLKVQNRALMEENTRLSDLTRMLLSSPSFSSFLDTLSPVDGLPAPVESSQRPPVPIKAPRPTENPTASAPKDANPYAAHQQVGMALVPDTNTDFSMLELNHNWPTGYLPGVWGTNQPQVFSMLELPEGPAVDTSALSGKSSSFTSEIFSNDEAKVEAPVIERMPVIEEQTGKVCIAPVAKPEEDLGESDPAFSLFADAPVAEVTKAETAALVPVLELLQGITIGKAPRFELVSAEEANQDVTAADMDLFQRLCDSTEAALRRIDALTRIS
ncbi:MAG: hypothetical protein M1839_007328 [Geoglossum umbratile]|nr:MAG: hypothetical protein M1839_007328 [Geoglossum umbratile]